jgi:hypothetical protein
LFVSGFDGNHDMMRRFEKDWQRRWLNMLQAGTITMPEQIADVLHEWLLPNGIGMEWGVIYAMWKTGLFHWVKDGVIDA